MVHNVCQLQAKVCARSSSSLPRKSGARKTDRPAMTIAVDYDVTRQNKQKKHIDGAHGIGVQNVTSNCNVTTIVSFYSPYI